MRQSRPITESGRLVGAAVTEDQGWFLVAIDPRLEDLHGATFANAAEAERVARLVLARQRDAREDRRA